MSVKSRMMMIRVLFLFCAISHGYGLQVTSTPPLLDVPTYSLATKDADGKTGMNILTYATPVSIKPDRIWSIGLYKGTCAHDNFANTRKGVLQLLSPRHAKAVKLLGGSSGRDVDKRQECEKLGLPWMSADNELPELLPGCTHYLRLSLVGDLIDCGSHDVALCKIESILVGDDAEDLPDHTYLNTAKLRDLGIITEQGRVAE